MTINPLAKPPTDLKILQTIYDRHAADFVFKADERSAKIFVPVDIPAVASSLGVDADIVFGRLYYTLEPRFGFERSDGSKVNFFTLQAGEDFRAVNFPMLVGVLADLREAHARDLRATRLAIAALCVSILSLAVSALAGAL